MGKLDAGIYREKVRGCWLGKNVGGAFGAPFECEKKMLDLEFYRPVPTEPVPNDDLDLQLMWLVAMEEIGREPTLTDLAAAWRRFMPAFPWDEYGIASFNLDSGLEPPISGWFRNGYIDNMGSPIRSEIWACLAPGDPQRAALMAMRDATLDHAGGEGVYGEIFWSALQSAAFVEGDRDRLLRIGLNAIPAPCLIARVTRQAIFYRLQELPFEEARDKIARLFSNPQHEMLHSDRWRKSLWGGLTHPCHAIVNQGFTVLAWLYGEDFGDAMCRAVNCGYDTDCTAATLGATLGILAGDAGLPARWLEPLGTGIATHAFSKPFPEAPADIDELTDRTIALAHRLDDPLDIVSPDELWRSERIAAGLRELDPHSAQVTTEKGAVTLHYAGEPVLRPGEPRWVRVSVRADSPATTVTVAPPTGWTAERDGDAWKLAASDEEGGEVRIVADLENGGRLEASFVFLPVAAAPWPVEGGVPKVAESPWPRDRDVARTLATVAPPPKPR